MRPMKPGAAIARLPRPDGDAGRRTRETMGLPEPARPDDQAPDGGLPAADRQAKPVRSPERTCAVTRALLAPADLIRFARAPDGTITPDVAHRLPGRGVWVSLDRGMVEKAATQNAFARSLKQSVIVPAGLADLVDRLLSERCVQALAIANKAGLVVSGFAKVEAKIRAGGTAALLHGREASADGAAKLDGKLRSRMPPAQQVTDTEQRDAPPVAPVVVTDLSSRELSLALGRENVVHAAVSEGGAARYFLTEVERLRRYRSSTPAAAARPPRKRPNTEQA